MPFDPSLYPADWAAISQRVKERACWRCEWPHCGADHGTWIERRTIDLEYWEPISVREAKIIARVARERGMEAIDEVHIRLGFERPVKVIITTSHKCYCVPICGDEDHLWALCQLHHLRFDTRQRVIAAAGTRRAEDAQAGQGFLFHDIDAESPRKALRAAQERSAAPATEETT